MPAHTPAVSAAEQALRARLVAGDSPAHTHAATARLHAICEQLAAQLTRHKVPPTALATLESREDGRGQKHQRATHVGDAWRVAGHWLSTSGALLHAEKSEPATASQAGLGVTRYATTITHPWGHTAPERLEDVPTAAALLAIDPAPVSVRGILHTTPGQDVERNAVGAGSWYVRDVDATITLHPGANGLALRHLERDLVRDVVAHIGADR